jgi:UDP-3-O-[3-hydroxymyristoyl] N-acetylglucosamine deacetylase
MHRQRTLNESVGCKGIGLHTGKIIHMWIHPAPEDHGIVFLRTDTKKKIAIPACMDTVVNTTLATTLGNDGETVSTVEHLLSACFGMGIDNALVEINGPEVPIMDGSAAPFVYLLKSAGARRQNRFKRFLMIRRPFDLRDGEKRVSLLPARELKISFSIEFHHPLINHQSLDFVFSDAVYDRGISKARTFGFLREVEDMKSRGFGLGGSLDNAVVLDDFRVLNEEGLRYSDEFVRHKILDSLGDLSLIGMPVLGHFVAHKAGHTLNHHLMKKVLSQKKGWMVVSFPSADDALKASVHLPSVGLLDVVPASA